ncbi:MAG: Na(+)-translocating NADH-quinone reductase subunit C, partial [Candidatus Latescibacteria bacterium]|nr:Na(+)-translocating NADH-quinone reductase subunit C [Candidatus Latescibacterota bacterium]
MANDSVGRTFGVALGVCLVCSVLVSAAAVSLRPTQAVNKALDKKRNILMAA